MPFLLLILCAKAGDPWPGGVACLASWLACFLLSSRASGIQGGGIKTFRAKSPDVSIDICSMMFPT